MSIEKFKPNKKVMIEKDSYDNEYRVIYTDNGYQWSGVFRGSLEHGFIILEAYVKTGYEDVSEIKKASLGYASQEQNGDEKQ